MKKILFLFLFTLSLAHVAAQYPRASIWTSEMANFAAQDAVGIPTNVVLFAGSSTFTKWTSLKTDFPASTVLNRGFGGSWMTDLIYYFKNVVEPYKPSQVVLYEGDNDLIEATKTPESFMDDVIAMTRLINIYYPDAKILLISIKPSPSRTAYFTKYQAANALMKTYAENHSDLMTYVDMWPLMLNSDGTPNTSLYVSDMLHFNADGYLIWKNVLTPLLNTSTVLSDKTIFTESSNPYYHDPSWVNATAPSTFTTATAGKISTDSMHFHNGNTSLKIEYQGFDGGDWQACVAAAAWTPFSLADLKAIEFWVATDTQVEKADLPYLFLESSVGTKSGKVMLSSYLNSIPAGATWTKVIIPVADIKAISPTFSFSTVKTIFFSQLNANASTIKFFVDDIICKATDDTPVVGTGAVLMNFGAGTPLTNWNNITDTQAAVNTLIDDSGAEMGATLKVTDPFYVGYNTNGTLTPSGDAAIFPPTVTTDNFFGHGLAWNSTPANAIGEITISGLNPAKYYSFSVFACRNSVTDIRDASYTFTGLETKSGTLDASNNTSNVVNIVDLKPTVDGVITMKTEAGPANNNSIKFFYLGAMKMTVADSPTALNLIKSNTQNAYYTNGLVKINDYTGLVNIYDVTGRTIYSGQSIFGQLAVNLVKGTYLISTTNGNTKFSVN